MTRLKFPIVASILISEGLSTLKRAMYALVRLYREPALRRAEDVQPDRTRGVDEAQANEIQKNAGNSSETIDNIKCRSCTLS